MERILCDPDNAEVVLRSGKALDPGGIQEWLGDAGIIIGPSLAHSIWCLKKWRWLVLAYYVARNYTRRSLRV